MIRRAFLKFAAVALLHPVLNWQMPSEISPYPLTAERIIELLNATLKDLGRFQFADIAAEIADYKGFVSIFSQNERLHNASHGRLVRDRTQRPG